MKLKIQTPQSKGNVSVEKTETEISSKVKPLADGKSFLVGNRVVRIANKLNILKKNRVRLLVREPGKPSWPMIASIEVVRPIQTQDSLGGAFIPELRSPMVGKVISIPVKVGQKISEGQLVCIIEAMKMENRICAESGGIVKSISIKEGESVNTNDICIVLSPE